MHEFIHAVLSRMQGCDRFTCPMGVGSSKVTGVLAVEGMGRANAMKCETRVGIVPPDCIVLCENWLISFA